QLFSSLLLPKPSSQFSPAAWFTFLSPHIAIVQSMLQSAVSRGPGWAGSPPSHCSLVTSTTPPPQNESVQLLWQPSLSSRLPSSHCSPGSRMPLPQPSPERQSALQPSPSIVLPSSHTSPTCTSTMPLPHTSVDLHGPGDFRLPT